jgi:hypothetical protein
MDSEDMVPQPAKVKARAAVENARPNVRRVFMKNVFLFGW